MSYVPNRLDKDGNRIKITKADIEFGNRGKRKPTHPKNKNPKTTEQKRKEFLRNAVKRAQEVRSTTPSEKATKISRKEMMEKKRRDVARRLAEAAKRRAEAARRRAEAARRRKEIERRKKNLELARKDRGRNVKTTSALRKPKTSGRKDPTVKAPGSGTRVKRPLKGLRKGQQPNITAADLKNVKSLPSSKVKKGVPKLSSSKRGSDRMAAGKNIQRAALLKISKLRGQRSQPKKGKGL